MVWCSGLNGVCIAWKTVPSWPSFEIHGILVQDPFWHLSCHIFNTGQYHAPVLIPKAEIKIAVKKMSNFVFPFHEIDESINVLYQWIIAQTNSGISQAPAKELILKKMRMRCSFAILCEGAVSSHVVMLFTLTEDWGLSGARRPQTVRGLREDVWLEICYTELPLLASALIPSNVSPPCSSHPASRCGNQ